MADNTHNRKNLKDLRQQNRSSLTPAEAELWKHLQSSKLDGRKFRRQHSIGNYILDFYCPQEKLGIELDGQVHFTDSAYEADSKRTEYLNSLNIKIIRFENKAVFEQLEGVLEEIRQNFTTPNPS
ncbi:endonuclease domain-containing protein [Adhaeribacter rhizoryzae]|uniref:Endonuclease domain-containing protein n=1 Tax=Adhaeribacter rhizoryzae TaxID=2607907 RepID=A0A5M6D9N4_9BACT|nr:endonuclease domain-containing protein [Adhaeribacter rhizoryzae]KAA5544241.1 endonuclease domain-containing protein [Adhaeribacter rhizoryzae]